MKKIYLVVIAVFIFFVSNAQELACAGICSKDLSSPVYASVLQAPSISYAKDASTPNYHDVQYNDDQDDPSTLCFNNADQCDDDKDALFYKTFYPDITLSNYKACPLPCVIVVHGGVFFECSRYTLITGFCKQLASRGFVVFDVEYRRGRKGDDIPPVNPLIENYTSVQQMLAVYRGCQDVRGAIRSIIKRANNEATFNDPWRIDVDNIFLAGESAGAVTILNAAYYTQTMMNQLFPTQPGGVSITAALGNLDAGFYYGEATIDYLSHIKGVFGTSSGMFIPNSYASNPSAFFPANTPKIPAILFHGQLDEVFNINRAPVYLSPKKEGSVSHIEFNSETYCLNAVPYKADSVANTPDLIAAGALGIKNYFLQPLGIKSEVYVDCQMHHILDKDGPHFHSDFGTGFTTHDDVVNYEAARAATFFQAIMGSIVNSLNKNVFRECENFRIKCNPADNYSNTCCTNCSATDNSKCDPTNN